MPTHIDRRTLITTAAALPICGVSISFAQARDTLFKRLWDNHPLQAPPLESVSTPCTALIKAPHCNSQHRDITEQCTVRMGVCLKRTLPTLTHDRMPKIRWEPEPHRVDRPRTCAELTLKQGACERHTDAEMHLLNATELLRAMDAMTGTLRASYPELTAVKPGVWIGDRSKFRSTLRGKKGFIYFGQFWIRQEGTSGSHFDLWDGSMTKNEVPSGEEYTHYVEAKGIRFWEILDA